MTRHRASAGTTQAQHEGPAGLAWIAVRAVLMSTHAFITVLTVFNEAFATSPDAPTAPVSADDAGHRFADLMHRNPDAMDYVGRALAEGGEIGKSSSTASV